MSQIFQTSNFLICRTFRNRVKKWKDYARCSPTTTFPLNPLAVSPFHLKTYWPHSHTAAHLNPSSLFLKAGLPTHNNRGEILASWTWCERFLLIFSGGLGAKGSLWNVDLNLETAWRIKIFVFWFSIRLSYIWLKNSTLHYITTNEELFTKRNVWRQAGGFGLFQAGQLSQDQEWSVLIHLKLQLLVNQMLSNAMPYNVCRKLTVSVSTHRCTSSTQLNHNQYAL